MFLLLFAFFFVCAAWPQASAELPRNLSCYQCRVAENEDCADPSFLKPCPAGDGAFDRCMTTVTRRDGRKTITKSCTIAPCDMAFVAGLPAGLPCDTTLPEYTCVHCCRENGCNASSSGSSLLHMLTSDEKRVVIVVLCFALFIFLPNRVIFEHFAFPAELDFFDW